MSSRFPDLDLRIVATDADAQMFERASAAVYQFSSVKDLPPSWRELAFTIRVSAPAERFDPIP